MYLIQSMRGCRARNSLVFLTILFTFQAWPANSQETNQADITDTQTSDLVTLNFANAEIEGVIKAVSKITGKNFVIDPRVKGTVNIISEQPVPRDLVYEVLVSALRMQGFATVEDRGIVSIVPEGDAKLQSGGLIGPLDNTQIPGDQIQTRVFNLDYVPATQLVPVLRPLIAPNNIINAYQNSNTLIITDYASNLQRLGRIIDSIDQPVEIDPVVIPLLHASAVDVAETVNRLYSESLISQGTNAMEPSMRFSVTADARSNSLLARVGNPALLSHLREFVEKLDATTNTDGNIHVVYLKNAEAVILAETLRAIYRGDTTTAVSPADISSTTTAAMQATDASPFDYPERYEDSVSPHGIIQADAATNSIIITAPDAIYNNLRAALEKLDVRRAQVYVEAVIAEVTADKAAEFGIQWQDLSGLDETSTQPFGGTNFDDGGRNIINLSRNPASAAPGLNIGVIAGRVLLPGIGEILNLGVLVRALESDANANILSTPTLLTMDNQEASIIIGQNVPIITGQYALTGAATTPTPFQTIERQDVGLTLRVKPQISEGGTVRLQLYQEVSSIQDRFNPAGVITNKRAVASTVLVDDGQIVVIGGLIQDTANDDVQKVPLLGSIPVLGNLFRYKSRTHTKTNLMVFLRPTLVRDAQGVDPFTSERYRYILDEQNRTRPEPSNLLRESEWPTLPP